MFEMNPARTEPIIVLLLGCTDCYVFCFMFCSKNLFNKFIPVLNSFVHCVIVLLALSLCCV